VDIFDIAQQGIDIEKAQIEEEKKEEASAAKAKAYKVDIFEAINAVASKDYDWYNRLGEKQKSFQPFMLNMWLSMVWNKDSKQKKFTTNDKIYAELLKKINHTLNKQLFTVPKEMYWLLACTIQEYDAPFITDYKKSVKKTASSKYNINVINYMAKELYSSNEKIMDMIDNGLITTDDMTEIEKDLDTLEDQTKKKKNK